MCRRRCRGRLAAIVLALSVACLAWTKPADAAATKTASPVAAKPGAEAGKVEWFEGAYRLFALGMGLTRDDARAFLVDSRRAVVPVAGGVAGVGLICCFFGWRLLKFGVALVGAIFGIWVGLVVTLVLVLLAGALLAPVVPKEYSDWVAAGLFVVVGTPVCTFGARIGRRCSRVGPKRSPLDGADATLGNIAMWLLRPAFLDISIIWGYTLFGAMLVAIGAYCAAVPLLDLPAAQLQSALTTCGVVALVLGFAGGVAQMRSRRSKLRAGHGPREGGVADVPRFEPNVEGRHLL